MLEERAREYTYPVSPWPILISLECASGREERDKVRSIIVESLLDVMTLRRISTSKLELRREVESPRVIHFPHSNR